MHGFRRGLRADALRLTVSVRVGHLKIETEGGKRRQPACTVNQFA
jgi:hypothetical protein